MEKVLDVYKRPYNKDFPVLCMDESPRQLIRETRTAIPAAAGRPECYDYEYERCGRGNIFMVSEPLAGRRMVKVTEHRRKSDWASFIQEIAQRHEEAAKITLVMDNLNTHGPGSLYETFAPGRPRLCGTDSSLSTPPSMAVGSTWPRSNSTYWPASA